MTEPTSPKALTNSTLRRHAQHAVVDGAKDDKPILCCGHAYGPVTLRPLPGGGYTPTGISTCRRVWECAVCAASAQMKRRESLRASLAAWMSCRRDVVLLTLTLPHLRSDDLLELLMLLDAARRSMLAGSARARLLSPHGVQAVDWTLEVTFRHEGGGWHPHLHVLFYLDAEVDDGGLQRLHGDVAAAWHRSVKRAAGRRIKASENSVHVRRVDDAAAAAAYLTKMPCNEDGRGQGGFAVLSDYHDHLSANDCSQTSECARCRQLVGVWREYVAVMADRHRFHAPAATRVSPSATHPETRPESREKRRSIIIERDGWDLVCQRDAQVRVFRGARTGGVCGVRSVLAELLVQDGSAPRRATRQARRWVRTKGGVVDTGLSAWRWVTGWVRKRCELAASVERGEAVSDDSKS